MQVSQLFFQQCQAAHRQSAVKRWVIALSGGLDSMVTLDLAKRMLAAEVAFDSIDLVETFKPVQTIDPVESTEIVALHVNHQQQNSANQWQAFCQAQCDQRDVAFFPFTLSPLGHSEKILRDARYACFSTFLEAGDCLLLGHHANDQVETLLFRLIRGAGAKGLSGMPLMRDIANGRLLRPLLTATKNNLLDYAVQAQLEWVDDPSNQSTDYDRNFIRHQVLAPLVEHWPKACEQISLSSQLLTQEQQVLSEYLMADVAKISTEHYLDLGAWKRIREPKATALLRHWLSSLIGRVITRKEQQRIIYEVIDSRIDSRAYCQLGEYQLRRFKQQLYLFKLQQSEPWPELQSKQHQYSLLQGCLKLLPSERGVSFIEGMYLQNRVDGMWVTPVNRPRKKLKKIFQEHNIPPWQRDNWPLLMYRDEIVAIPGVCICEGWFQKTRNKANFYLDWQPL